ncbi:O-antigen ligase C-terminal domain-containing protein [Enterobacter hormaechei]|nr:O-antigen ligase C-terminal domain-containing protein [Enterobacter hormaechei]
MIIKSKNKKEQFLMIIISLWLCILMHLPLFNTGGSGFVLPQNIVTWMVVVCLCFTVVVGGNYKSFVITPTLLLFFTGAVLITIPVSWSGLSPLCIESLPRFIGMWAGIFLYACLLQVRLKDSFKRNILLLIAISACIESCIVLQELFFPEYLDALKSQFIEHNGRQALGSFQQVNVTSSWIATGLAACISLSYKKCFISKGVNKIYGKRENKFSFEGVIYSIVICFLMITLLLTQSRTGWLGGIICCGIFYLLILRGYRERRGKYLSFNGWIIIFSPLIGILIGLIMMNVSAAQALAQHAGSNNQRMLTLYTTWEMIKIHPLKGWGIGTFSLEFQQYLSGSIHRNSSHELMTHPHNELLYIWFEGGIIALAGFVLIVSSIIKLLLDQKTITGMLRWTVLVPIVLHTQLEFPFYYSASHFIVILIVMSMLENSRPHTTIKNQSAMSFRLQCILNLGATAIACLTLLWLVSIFHLEYILSKFEQNLLPEPDKITTIYVPPMGALRYKHDKNTLHLIDFYDTHAQDELELYVTDNRQSLKIHPNPDDYYYQIQVLKFLGQNKEADYNLEKARDLFPWDSRFNVGENDK